MFESNMFAWVMLRQHSILGRERPGSAQPGDRTCGLRSSWYNLQFCQMVEHSMFFTVSVSPSFLVMPWAASTLDTSVCWQPCALGFCCQLHDFCRIPMDMGMAGCMAVAGGQLSPDADVPMAHVWGVWGMGCFCPGLQWHSPVHSSARENSPPAQLPFLSKRVPSCLVCTSSMFVTFLLIQSLGPVFSRELSSASEVKPCQFATSFSGAGIFSELC